MKILIYLAIVCYSYTAYGQHYIPVDKMIANYKEKKNVDNLKNHDIIYCVEEAPEVGIFMERTLFPDSLPAAEDIRAEWCLEYTSGYDQTLYLKKLYSSQKEKNEEAKMYESKLADKYGKNHLGIPAVWYTGKVTVLSCPRNLFGEIVTKYMIELSLVKGQIVSYKFVNKAKNGTMEGARRPKAGEKYSPVQTADGCWHSNFEYKLDMLDEFANATSEKHETFATEFQCSLLVVTNKKGKAKGYLLSPVTMVNKMLVNKLLKRISELPEWSLGWLYTIDGSILQGRYLKATYSSEKGWEFRDYLDR